MNSRKQHKSICFILILSMLFLGMCFENIEADSSLAYQLVSQADSTLRSSQNTSLFRQIYMEESIGRPVGNSIQLNARRNNSRTGRGTDVSLLSADILLQTFPHTSIVLSPIYGSASHSTSVIVDYIHHKDGKKAAA